MKKQLISQMIISISILLILFSQLSSFQHWSDLSSLRQWAYILLISLWGLQLIVFLTMAVLSNRMKSV
ncbi:protein-S-isoprenylcysteine O-methyltransferase Ste14 [Rossellomorea marisflavi]